MVAVVARPTTTYATIVADPPWPLPDRVMRAGGRRARDTEVPYEFMSLDEIKALPVAGLAADDAILWLWSTRRDFREGNAAAVARAWGFSPVGEIIWGLRNPGFGQFLGNDHEPVLVAKRGRAEFTGDIRLGGVHFWRQSYEVNGRGIAHKVHSAKPEAFLDFVETVSPEPRVELFARRHRLGWDVWGNESANTAAMPDEPIVAATPLDEAESILLAFSGVLLGNDGRGAGLLSRRVDGRFHTRGCQVGMWLRPGHGPEGCSDRCASAREALDAAERWLRAREAGR